MVRTIEVEVDATGEIHIVEPACRLPQGRAQLTWESPGSQEAISLSETSLAEDWLKPEEDAAWAHLQPAK